MDTDELIGRILSHYKVLEKLGEGGMGAVYRALDTRLDRMVALKVLPAQKTSDPERKKRFVQEAKTASSLNHPNIVTIYDIETQSEPNYIAMEYVAGKTLHECIARQGLPVSETLRYAVPIADALAAAHAAGIVHRDLKPGNIMVTEKGLVKVLDFGLAKLTEPVEVSDATVTIDYMAPRTMQGMIVGTAAYMSPEQAEGKKVDARSDIFSFGTVLYEMVTGRRPFQGETAMSTLSAIILREPSPVSEISRDTPPELERLILRCLRKEPERRVQHMDDLKVALEELREESTSGRLISGVRTSDVPAAAGPVSAGPASAGPASASVSAALPAPAPRRLGAAALLVGGIVLLAAAGAALWWWQRGTPPAGPPMLTRLTSDSGLSAYPALSPDGRLLAYASDRSGEGNLDIWVQQIGGGEPIRLTRDEADEYEPAFSPDGTRVAFRSEREGGGIYVVPTLGGESRLLARLGHNPRFSPDGNWVAYWLGATGGGFAAGSGKIFLVPSPGGEPRQVHPEVPAGRDPIWMADGKRLLFLGKIDPKAPVEQGLDWWVTPVAGGTPVRTGAFAAFREQKLLPPPGAYAISAGAVSPANDLVLFSARLGDTTNLWEIVISPKTGEVSGAPRRVTFGTDLEMEPSAGAEAGGRAGVAFASLTHTVNVWSLPLDVNRGAAPGELQRITQGVTYNAYPSISADGKKLVYTSAQSGAWNVWIRDLESGKQIALTASRGKALQPKISADGTTVAYWEDDGTKQTIYVIPARGGVPQKVCDDCGPPTHVSPDGTKVLFESENSPQDEAVMVADLTSGKQYEMARSRETPKLFPYAARFSPDGRWVAFHARSNPLTRQIFVVPFQGSDRPPVPKKDWIAVTSGVTFLEGETYWSPDGSLLYFLSENDGFRCIWAQRLEPPTKHPRGAPFAVIHFHHARNSLTGVRGSLGAIGMSVGNDKLVFALGDLTGNIWMTKGQGQP
ncbi:MAG TPA: protein kinase [Bryobacterales bacterium]|nr:protein kinase [Bryobacterales bacterium]